MKYLIFLISIVAFSSLDAQKIKAYEDEGTLTVTLKDSTGVHSTELVDFVLTEVDTAGVAKDITVDRKVQMIETVQSWRIDCITQIARLAPQADMLRYQKKKLKKIDSFLANPKIKDVNASKDKRKTPTDVEAKKLNDILEKGATEKELSRAFTKVKLIKALIKLQENN